MALLGNLKGSANFFQSTAFYNGVATQSLRFDTGSSTVLSKTPSASNLKTWTWSAWVKRSKLGVERAIWSVGATSVDFALFFHTTDQLRVWTTGGSAVYYTDRVFRDTSAWYHIAITSNNVSPYIRLYINGVLNTTSSYDNRTSVPSTNNLSVNTNAIHRIGAWNNGGLQYFDGYLADVNHIDGTAVGDTGGILDEFIEIKNGVCIPKAYTGSYGTNGYRLEFKQTGTGTASSSTIGADTSGNDNHYTSSGIASTDCNIADSPENNMCTLNLIGRRYGQSYVGTFSEGSLKVASGGNATDIYGTMAINQVCAAGGVYFEIRLDSIDSARTYFGLIGDSGINNVSQDGVNGASYSYPIKAMVQSGGYMYFGTQVNGAAETNIGGGALSGDYRSIATYTNGDVIGFAVKSDGKVFISKNGTFINSLAGSPDPANGTNPIHVIDLDEGDWLPYVGYSSSFSVNFGQDGSFSGQETSGGHSDENGIGDFFGQVPSGYLALCTSNMVKPSIGPDSATQADSYMDVLNYTGNNTVNTDISGLNFKPDLIWTFARGSASTHNLATDSSRGVHKDVFLSTGGGESNDTDGILAFNSDGFRLGTSTNHNVNSRTYTTFNWRANGGTTTTNDASATSIGSIDSVIQANTTAGFSIVTYTGDSTGNNGTASTVAHGLGAVPKWIITIPLNVNDGAVYHQQNTTAPETDTLILASVSGNNPTYDGSGFWNDTAPTSTVFSVGSRRHTNSDGGVVAYCWTEIEGFSKFGSFIGNSNNDGPFIYTGFQPAWVMLKNASRSADWRINDTTRQPANDDGGHLLLANSTSAEITNEYDMDFLSNGFKLKSSDVYENGSGELIVYMAFAGVPFKYSNAR